MLIPTNNPFLLFMHIPKTAGTTLRSIVDAQYGEENVLTFYNQPDDSLFENIGEHIVIHPHLRALIGHFKFGVHKSIIGSTKYVTFLRDPIKRCISEYNERVATDPTAYLAKDGDVMSLELMIDLYPPHFSNLQTRYICGKKLTDEITEDDLDSAIRNLKQHFAFIGLTENFDQSIQNLNKILKWPPVTHEVLNKKPNIVDMTTAIEAKLANLNKFDSKLYEFAAQQFN